MTDRKVASRKERLMFEQLIRQDMENRIQRGNGDQTPNNNQNQTGSPNSNYNNINQNYP